MTKKTKAETKREAILAKSEEIIKAAPPAKRPNAGQPPAYETSLELSTAIEGYFIQCQERTRPFVTMTGKVVEVKSPAPLHITGLCCFLGISDETLNNYEKRGDDDENQQYFGSVITRAKKRCENYAVDQLFEGQKGNKADFVLKNNFRWEDKMKTDLSLEGNIIAQIHEGRRRAGLIEDE